MKTYLKKTPSSLGSIGQALRISESLKEIWLDTSGFNMLTQLGILKMPRKLIAGLTN